MKRFQKKYSLQSSKSARQYVAVAVDLGFLEVHEGQLQATASGKRLAETGDRTLVRSALFKRIDGMWTLCELLHEQPRRIGLLLEPMQEAGFNWQTDRQIRYRLRWLEEAGVVESRGKARTQYSLTNGIPRR